MPRFTKKPVEIEAQQLTATNAAEIMVWINDHYADDEVAVMRGGPGGGSRGATLYIRTLEGTHHASIGDWVIRGVQHEFYPCKPDIFEATYDPVPAHVGYGDIARSQSRAAAFAKTERPEDR